MEWVPTHDYGSYLLFEEPDSVISTPGMILLPRNDPLVANGIVTEAGRFRKPDRPRHRGVRTTTNGDTPADRAHGASVHQRHKGAATAAHNTQIDAVG